MIFLSRKEYEKAIEKAANEKLCNYFRWEEQTERFNCIDHRLDDFVNELSSLRKMIDAIGELVGNIDA